MIRANSFDNARLVFVFRFTNLESLSELGPHRAYDLVRFDGWRCDTSVENSVSVSSSS